MSLRSKEAKLAHLGGYHRGKGLDAAQTVRPTHRHGAGAYPTRLEWYIPALTMTITVADLVDGRRF